MDSKISDKKGNFFNKNDTWATNVLVIYDCQCFIAGFPLAGYIWRCHYERGKW